MRAPASGFLPFVALANRHQARHLAFGQSEFLPAELGQTEVGDLVRDTTRLLRLLVCVHVARLLLPLPSLLVEYAAGLTQDRPTL